VEDGMVLGHSSTSLVSLRFTPPSCWTAVKILSDEGASMFTRTLVALDNANNSVIAFIDSSGNLHCGHVEEYACCSSFASCSEIYELNRVARLRLRSFPTSSMPRTIACIPRYRAFVVETIDGLERVRVDSILKCEINPALFEELPQVISGAADG
jgi:hypothetical protein